MGQLSRYPIIEKEPVFDLLERWFELRPRRAPLPGSVGEELVQLTEAFLRDHGRLKADSDE